MPRFLTVTALVCVSTVAMAQSKPGLFDPDVFRTIQLRFKQPGFKQTLITNKPLERYIKADLTVDGNTFRDVGVRGRGGQTWGRGRATGKLPLKISMDEFVPGQRWMGRRSIVLGVCFEPSFLREAITFRLMRKYLPAPEANYVKLVVNGASWGVYLNIEVLNSDFLREHFDDTSGNRYKGWRLNNYGPDPNAYLGQKLLSSPRPDSHKDLAASISRMSLTGARHEAEVPIGLDVDAMHRYFACNTLCTVTDTFPIHNFYIYVDPHHGQLSILPWDVNYSIRTPRFAPDPIWLRGSSSNLWTLRYRGHLRQMVEAIDIAEVTKWIQDYHKLVLAEMQKETMWFYPTQNIASQGLLLINYLRQIKSTYMAGLGPSRVTFSNQVRTPYRPVATDTVWLTVRAQSSQTVQRVVLHSRARGRFREQVMFDDGKHNDGKAGDGVWGISVPPGSHRKFEYYFSAEAGGTVAFHPVGSAHHAYSYSSFTVARTGLLIHEFLTDNTKGIRDEKGEYEDWIELLNPTNATINTGGMFLSDDIDDLKKWQLPAVPIPPGYRLLIWADDDPKDGPLHANFKLGNDEGVFLTDRDGVTIRDFVEFENQLPDISMGRLFDRLSPFVSFATPTPLRPNELLACGKRRFAAQGFSPDLSLDLLGTPRLRNQIAFDFAGAKPNDQFLLMLGLRPDAFYFQPLRIPIYLGGPIVLSFYVPADANGLARVPMTVVNDPALDGYHVTFQALARNGTGLATSNGLEVRFCR